MQSAQSIVDISSEPLTGANAKPTNGNPAIVDAFIDMYQQLNKDNLFLLRQVYRDDIAFRDPMHEVSGIDDLTRYFANMYLNVSHIEFNIKEVVVSHNNSQAALYWTMTYSHPKLNKGQYIQVEGMSQLKFDDKIYSHRDYFDLGQMLYEQVPFLGGLIGLLKNRAAK
ncbi:transcriptional regulator [Shewanella ulleungensis]|jgi:limonene-1,2-epoxide hydrolase|uniref:Transcriptional regulator n=2 Tax=Shewanella ulleungensis TaxID=2282699 RepID=A0ABQ2QHV7_9GAMM|nr:transcriptional regulator [Shewanella ulleungensis]